jgi:hypothetical protein
MRETTRAHTRLVDGEDPGIRLRIDSILPAPVEVFVPQRIVGLREVPLLVHFMGATWVPRRAIAAMPEPMVVAAVHLGAGSAINAAAFSGDSTRFPRLVAAIGNAVRGTTGAPALRGTYLSAWSAGYGAIREILKHTPNAAPIDGILLLDGLHADYRPDRVPLAAGGILDSTDLLPFVPFAREATQGRRRFVITHSEIFPGTFASTTETTDWLLDRLGMRRTAVLEWGPMGSQVLSRSVLGGLEVIGMAGNTAPDHVDHFHGMGTFVARLLARP